MPSIQETVHRFFNDNISRGSDIDTPSAIYQFLGERGFLQAHVSERWRAFAQSVGYFYVGDIDIQNKVATGQIKWAIDSALFTKYAATGFLYDFTKTDRTFQDDRGITGALVAGDPVALILDSSLWGGKTLEQLADSQPEIVPDPGFNNPEGWVLTNSTVSMVDGKLIFTDSGTNQGVYRDIGMVLGKRYRVTIKIDQRTSGNVSLRCGASGIANVITPAAGTHSVVVECAGGNPQRLYIFANGASNAVFDSISVKEIPGNHGVQAASNSYRPLRQASGYVKSDGSDDYLASAFVPASQLTLAGRGAFPATAGAVSKVLVGNRKNTAPVANAFLGMNTSGLLYASIAGANLTGPDVRGLTGTAAATYDGTTVRLYWNGAEVASGAGADGLPSPSSGLFVFGLNNGGTPGSFGDYSTTHVEAFDKTLSPADILALSNYWNSLP